MSESGLPAGWSLARVRTLVPEVELLDPQSFLVVADLPDCEDYLTLKPRCIFDLGGLCLVLGQPPEDGWWMGQVDEDEKSIICWATYGEADELGEAIAAL